MGKWCVESNVACLHDSYPPKNTKRNEKRINDTDTCLAVYMVPFISIPATHLVIPYL